MNERDECVRMHLVFHSRNPVETTVTCNRLIKRKCIIASKTRGQCTLILLFIFVIFQKCNEIKMKNAK